MRKPTAPLLVVLMAMLPLAMQCTLAAPQLPGIAVTVEPVDPVESDPVEYVHVHTTATVTVTNFPLGADVNVNASAETWVVSVSPTEFSVASGSTGAHEETINIDVRVPPRASAERDVILRVFANTTTPLGIEYSDEVETNLSVRQFFGLRLSTNATMSIDQGENLTNRLRITNTGNGLDNYTVTLNNGATLEAKGLTVTHDASVHEVGRDRIVSVIIEVTADAKADLGTVEALFTVRSQGDSTKMDTYTLTINVKEGTGGNGGNGNGDDGSDEEDAPLSTSQILGIIMVIVILLIGLFFLSRRAAEVEAEEGEVEDEDYY